MACGPFGRAKNCLNKYVGSVKAVRGN
jgi:hypothetical protein